MAATVAGDILWREDDYILPKSEEEQEEDRLFNRHGGHAYPGGYPKDKGAMAGINGRSRVLEDAKRLTCNDRNESYGPVDIMYKRIAVGWAEILGTDVTKEQVGMMMIWMKLARLCNSPDHRDSWVDIAGYAALTSEVANTKGE